MIGHHGAMGTGIDWRGWLLIALGVVAIVPSVLIIRRLRLALAPRDVTAPPAAPFDWREDGDLRFHLLVLVALILVALGVGLPRWWAVVDGLNPVTLCLFAYAIYLGFTVIQGLTTGKVKLQLRGFSAAYDRVGDPHRYWASMVANAALTCVILGIAIVQISLPTPQQTAANKRDNDRCYAQTTASNAAASIAACSRLLAGGSDPDERPYDLNARASAYAAIGNSPRAAADTVEALHAIEPLLTQHPGDKDLLALRDQLVQRRWQTEGALGRLNDAIVRDPRNIKLRLDRSEVWAKYQDYQNAVADLDEAHQLDPANAAVLAKRGLYSAWLNQTGAARRDLNEAEQRAPGSVTTLHGEAVLAAVQGDREGQLAWLGRALKADPRDDWALEQRARLYEASNDLEHSRADWDRLRAIRERQGRPLTGT